MSPSHSTGSRFEVITVVAARAGGFIAAVARVPAVTALRRVLRIAEVLFHLDLEPGLEDLLGELTQQPTRPDQVDTLVAGLGHEPLRDRRVHLRGQLQLGLLLRRHRAILFFHR